jgi:hypothetical protein
MKKFSSSDRVALVKLAASLPVGSKERRVIISSLVSTGVKKKASANLVIEGLDPKLQAKLDVLAKGISKEIENHALFDSHQRIKFNSSPTKYEETEQSEHGVEDTGYGLIGSILPKLSPKERPIITDILKSKRVGLTDINSLKRTFKDCVKDADGWAWEDTSQSFNFLWNECKGKAVDALSLNKYAEKNG